MPDTTVPKDAAWNNGNTCFCYQTLGKLIVGKSGPFYGWECIERSFRCMTGEPDPV